MRLSMDEVINAVCLSESSRRGIQPGAVEVQLSWEEEYGFTAEVWIGERSHYLVEANLKEAIEQYVLKEYGRRIYRSQITLDADEEFWADIAD
ncbi:DUF2653 family protein [Paenibacillus albicereus]|uniref:DUF2653 family protein n=1 Tax=Paenibacillus albicereus TaxID=2726185 RepID=A0A6H2GX95_9BACL|nr:DUF2653 family protein [Paenibacillus albicereus]QJC51979.1 DUF2653 family protein [Paenibacillus albicereus]